jgi:hypothetical protein
VHVSFVINFWLKIKLFYFNKQQEIIPYQQDPNSRPSAVLHWELIFCVLFLILESFYTLQLGCECLNVGCNWILKVFPSPPHETFLPAQKFRLGAFETIASVRNRQKCRRLLPFCSPKFPHRSLGKLVLISDWTGKLDCSGTIRKEKILATLLRTFSLEHFWQCENATLLWVGSTFAPGQPEELQLASQFQYKRDG